MSNTNHTAVVILFHPPYDWVKKGEVAVTFSVYLLIPETSMYFPSSKISQDDIIYPLSMSKPGWLQNLWKIDSRFGYRHDWPGKLHWGMLTAQDICRFEFCKSFLLASWSHEFTATDGRRYHLEFEVSFRKSWVDIHFYEFTFIDELILLRFRWDCVTMEAASRKRLLSENKLKLRIYGNVWLNLASACSETLDSMTMWISSKKWLAPSTTRNWSYKNNDKESEDVSDYTVTDLVVIEVSPPTITTL